MNGRLIWMVYAVLILLKVESSAALVETINGISNMLDICGINGINGINGCVRAQFRSLSSPLQ